MSKSKEPSQPKTIYLVEDCDTIETSLTDLMDCLTDDNCDCETIYEYQLVRKGEFRKTPSVTWEKKK